MKVVSLRERFGHMGSHSGYDQLHQYLNSNSLNITSLVRGQTKNLDIHSLLSEKLTFSNKFRAIFRRNPFSYADWKRREIYNLVINHSGLDVSPFYKFDSFLLENELLILLENEKYDLIFSNHIENSYGLCMVEPYRTLLKNTAHIGTIHQPMSWWKMYDKVKRLDNLAGVIALSEESQQKLQKEINCPIFHIPHGVDTNFFRPTSNRVATVRVIFAGQWLRNIDDLVAVLKIVVKERSEVHFDIIFPKNNLTEYSKFSRVAGLDQVEFHSNISDEDLLLLYQQASILFLPLIDSTANNTLLEGISCALPVVTTDLPSTREYVKESFGKHIKCGNVDGYVEAIIDLVDNPSLSMKMGVAARDFAKKNYDWNIIAPRTKSIMDQFK